MQDWHRSLGLANGGLTWAPSPLQPMMIEEPSQDPLAPPSVWQLIELTNGAQLRTEGTALHHCVASYADQCWRGASRIWSLRVHRGEKTRHVLTIEVDMKRLTENQSTEHMHLLHRRSQNRQNRPAAMFV